MDRGPARPDRRALGIKAVNFYGLSEMCGPGVATECLLARDGLHVNEDHFLVEAIDPDDGGHVPPGTVGELVFTTLTKEALPLIRYRTGDLGAITEEPCRCGRTTARLAQLAGRRDDMMIIRGVNVYPSHVEQILTSVDGVAPPLAAGHRAPGLHGRALARVRAQHARWRPRWLTANLGKRSERRPRRAGRGDVVEPGAMPRSEGKAVRVVDRR